MYKEGFSRINMAKALENILNSRWLKPTAIDTYL
jgi:hypothetical protein